MADQTANRTALATRSPAQLGGDPGARTYDQIISDLLAGKITRQQAMAELVALGTATGISRERATTLAQTALADTDSLRGAGRGAAGSAPRFDPIGDLGGNIGFRPEVSRGPLDGNNLQTGSSVRAQVNPTFGVNTNDFFFGRGSETLAGRRGIFGGFASNVFPNPTSRFRTAINAQRDPLSASFTLGGAAFPDQPLAGDFRAFLNTDPRAFTKPQFENAFNAIAPLFNPGATLDQGQQERRGAFDEEGVAENVIRQYFNAGAHPLFRQSINSVLDDRLNRFFFANPGSTGGELFGAFINDRGFGGPQFRPPSFGNTGFGSGR